MYIALFSKDKDKQTFGHSVYNFFYGNDPVFRPTLMEGRYSVVPLIMCVNGEPYMQKQKVDYLVDAIKEKGLAEFFENILEHSCMLDSGEIDNDEYGFDVYQCNTDAAPITVAYMRTAKKYVILNGNHRARAMSELGYKYIPVYQITDLYILRQLSKLHIVDKREYF